MNIKLSGYRFLTIAIVGASIAAVFTPSATAIPLKASGDPVVNGSGASMTARWSDVGEINGNSIDLFLEVVSHSGTASWVMVTEDDDFKFQFTNGSNGEHRSATLKWTFFEAGTDTPVILPSLAFTVDDLDDDLRHESLSTSDAYDYTVNSSTNLSHGSTGGVVSASGSGGIEHNTGDPESAVKLLFTDKSSLVITYNTLFDGISLSAYHHDGDGDFVFDNPPVHIYYTFDMTNNENKPVPVDFHNTLPDGLVWDPEYMELEGKLTGSPLQFSNGNTTVSANNIVLHPGSNSLKLRTQETSMSGEINNVATMDPKHPLLEPILHATTITLP